MTFRRVVISMLLLTWLGASAAMAQPVVRSSDSSRDCATCHMEWVDSYNRPQAQVLIDRPAKETVADEETCLGCHDGGVSDSRRDVWLEQGHKTSVAPPASMHVPANLPLQDGKVACRTCHTAHANPGNEKLTDIIFLRMPNDKGQLCQSCHGEKNQGPQHGTHPLGTMKLAIPGDLVAAGAKAGPDGTNLTCQTCHRSHGSRQDHLLVMGVESSQLCVSCHDQLKPGRWRPDVPHGHPQNPALKNDVQRQAIKDMGTHVGKNDTLICLSCHKLHEGRAGHNMLADNLSDGQFCMRCHPDRQVMNGSKHDLRTSAPLEKNLQGQTASESGPCGACHSFHDYSRKPAPQPADPGGLCMTCHAKGRVAAKAAGTSFAHPANLSASQVPASSGLKLYPGPNHQENQTLACLTCHNPHDTGHPKFLRKQREDLCSSCHPQQSQSLAGEHDFTRQPNARNARGQTGADVGRCGFCHDVHHANGPAIWTATAAIPKTPDDLCLQCHRKDGLASKTPAFRFSHATGPRTLGTTRPSTALPLFDESAHRSAEGFVTCASCHDPHVSKEKSRSLLRMTSVTSALCQECHPGQKSLAKGPHDESASTRPWVTREKVSQQDACMACHRAHSNDPARELFTVAPAAGVGGTSGVCVACHPKAAPTAAADAPFPLGAMLHPTTLPASGALAQAAHKMPLDTVRDAAGHDATAIGCKTCHNPHSNPASPHLLRVAENASPREVCVQCHADAKPLAHGMHNFEKPDASAPKSACGPCHATHAVASSARPMLWAVPSPAINEATNDTDKRCLSCHGAGGSAAKQPNIPNHPNAAMQLVKMANPATAPSNDRAGVDPITCLTCHLPHGKEIPLPPAMLADKTYVSAARPMLRPNVASALCATCHGADANRKFLYYHRAKGGFR